MPSLPARCFTVVGLDSALWDTSSCAPWERASPICWDSSLACMVADSVADAKPMRANATSATATSTTAAIFARKTIPGERVGAWVREPRPTTTSMRSRGARSKERSGYCEYAGCALMPNPLSSYRMRVAVVCGAAMYSLARRRR